MRISMFLWDVLTGRKCVRWKKLILSQSNTVFKKKNVIVYRDDRLEIFRNLSGPEQKESGKHLYMYLKKWVINNNQS